MMLHPEVQRKVQLELDTLLPGRQPPTMEDREKYVKPRVRFQLGSYFCEKVFSTFENFTDYRTLEQRCTRSSV